MKTRRGGARVDHLVVTLVVALSAGSCSDGGNSPSDGGGDDAVTTLTPEQLAGTLVTPICSRMLVCCTEKELDEFGQGGQPISNQASCEAALRPALQETASTVATSLAAGRIEFDARGASDCVAGLAAMTCPEFGGVMELTEWLPCGGIKGAVLEGQPCELEFECAAGYCAVPEDGPRKCQRIPTVYEPCPDFVCADGLFCEDVGSTCVPQKAEGVNCKEDVECLSKSCLLGATPMDPSKCGPKSSSGGLCDGQ